jgi:hypothetical protein
MVQAFPPPRILAAMLEVARRVPSLPRQTPSITRPREIAKLDAETPNERHYYDCTISKILDVAICLPCVFGISNSIQVSRPVLP